MCPDTAVTKLQKVSYNAHNTFRSSTRVTVNPRDRCSPKAAFIDFAVMAAYCTHIMQISLYIVIHCLLKHERGRRLFRFDRGRIRYLRYVTSHYGTGKLGSPVGEIRLVSRINEIACRLILRLPINNGNWCRVPTTFISRCFQYINNLSNC